MRNIVYKFYIWGRFNNGDDDSGWAVVSALDLYSAYIKLIDHIRMKYADFRLYTIKLEDTSTQAGVILEWLKQDETGEELDEQ